MKMTKKALLASAAVLAMGLGISSQAQAFDEVDWNWNKDVSVTERITVNVNDRFDWSGLVEIEKTQTNIGDVTATATLNDFENNPPGVGSGDTVLIDETFFINTTYAENGGDPTAITPADFTGDGVLTASFVDGDINESDVGTFDTGIDNVGTIDPNGIGLVLNVTGEVDVDSIEGVNDAIDLPKVENIATAVANNQSIESTVALQLHDAQYNMGGIDPEATQAAIEDGSIIGLALMDQTDNPHTDGALMFSIAAALGIVEQGVVSADATVDGSLPGETSVQNASVENAATAVGNNMSVDLEAASVGDAFVIADVTQWNYADVTANAFVDDVSIDGYTGFGDAGFGNLSEVQTPVVSNVATAVGNNFSIKVNNIVDVDTP